MSYILAIEPDPRQAAALQSVAKERLGAELTLVNSNVAAIASINKRLPDLILLTALLSPREEEELVAHLRTLEGAEHLQTLTIPLLDTGDDDGPTRGLFGFRKKKKGLPDTRRCDPAVFAEQINGYLKTAAELKATAEAAKEYATLRAAAAPAIEMTEIAETQHEPILTEGPDYVPDTVDSVPGEAAEAQIDATPVREEPEVERAPRPPLVSFSAERLGELLQRESKVGSDPGSPQISRDYESLAIESSVESSVDTSAGPSDIDPPVAAMDPSPVVDQPSELEPSPVHDELPAFESAVVFEPAAFAPVPATDLSESSETPSFESSFFESSFIEPPAVESPPAFEPPPPPAPQPQIVPLPPARLVKRLPPLAMWARIQRPEPEKPGKDAPTNGAFHLSELLESLRVPAVVSSISYPQGCRIQRVRTANGPNPSSRRGTSS